MVGDDDIKALLETDARRARVPAEEILSRIRSSGVRLGRPRLWHWIRFGALAEVLAVCLVLAALVLSTQHRTKSPTPQPAAAEASMVMHLTSLTGTATIQSGQAVPFPAALIHGTFQFASKIDSSSLRMRVEPATWHLLQLSASGETNSYSFVIRPDAGVSGRVSIFVDSAKDLTGRDLLREPAVFQLDTAPLTLERAALPAPLPALVQGAENVTVETVGVTESRTELASDERDWVMQAARSAVVNAGTDLGNGLGFRDQYRLEITTGGTTYVVMWQETKRFTVTWEEGGHQKATGFDQSDERLINAISEVLAARQRGESLRR